MDNPSAQRHQSEALSQLDNSSAPNQLLALSCFGDNENQETSLVGGSESQEICEGLNEEVDDQDIEREDDVHGACNDIYSSIEPLLLLQSTHLFHAFSPLSFLFFYPRTLPFTLVIAFTLHVLQEKH
jgi:hypothetical protein